MWGVLFLMRQKVPKLVLYPTPPAQNWTDDEIRAHGLACPLPHYFTAVYCTGVPIATLYSQRADTTPRTGRPRHKRCRMHEFVIHLLKLFHLIWYEQITWSNYCFNPSDIGGPTNGNTAMKTKIYLSFRVGTRCELVLCLSVWYFAPMAAIRSDVNWMSRWCINCYLISIAWFDAPTYLTPLLLSFDFIGAVVVAMISKCERVW